MAKQWIILTGAAGFVGRYLRFALNDQFSFWCIDNRPVNDMYVDDVFDQIDIGSVTSLTEIWERRPKITANLHAVIHLAAYFDYSNLPNPAYQRVNQGLERLLMLVSKDAPGNCLVISANSMGMLAPLLPGQRQNENSPRMATWEYPRSKVQAERILDQTTIRQPVVQLILAAIYSDWGEHAPLFNWIELCAAPGPEKHFYPGPPTRGLTYCHIEDIVRAFVLVIQKFGANGELIHQAELDLLEKRLKKSVEVSMEGGVREKFLIGQPQAMTYREIHGRACVAFQGKAIPLIQLPPEVVTICAVILEWIGKVRKKSKFIRPWMIKLAGEHFAFDLTRARMRLGWVPKRSIQQDLDAMLVRAVRERDKWLKVNSLRPR